MKLYNFFLFLSPVVALILEISPLSATLVFMPNAKEYVVRNYSYFDFIVFGNANFGPLLCAITTIVLIPSSIYFLIFKTSHSYKIHLFFCTIAFITSLLPLLYGIKFMNAFGFAISFCLLVELVLTITYKYASKSKLIG